MNSWRERLRDWRRGYTDADIASMQRKMADTKPGHVVWVTDAEMRVPYRYLAHLSDKTALSQLGVTHD